MTTNNKTIEEQRYEKFRDLYKEILVKTLPPQEGFHSYGHLGVNFVDLGDATLDNYVFDAQKNERHSLHNKEIFYPLTYTRYANEKKSIRFGVILDNMNVINHQDNLFFALLANKLFPYSFRIGAIHDNGFDKYASVGYAEENAGLTDPFFPLKRSYSDERFLGCYNDYRNKVLPEFVKQIARYQELRRDYELSKFGREFKNKLDGFLELFIKVEKPQKLMDAFSLVKLLGLGER